MRDAYIRTLRAGSALPRRSTTFLIITATLFAALAVAPSALAATPKLLFRATGLTSMSAGGGRIAWARTHGSLRCFGYSVWVRSDATGAVTRLRKCVETDDVPTMQGVTATRAYWSTHFESPGNETDDAVWQLPGTRQARNIDGLLLSCGGNGCTNCGPLGDTFAAAAVEDGTLVYATTSWDGDPSNCGGDYPGGKVVSGGSMRRGLPSGGHVLLGAAPGASLLAAAGGRFAELPLVPGGPAQPNVEVRSADDGSLISTIHPAGLVTGLAMSRAGVVLRVDAAGAATLRLYDPRTGELILSVGVGSTARLIDAAGERALYTVHGRTIRILNLSNGRTRSIYTTHSKPYDLSLDGRLISWHPTTSRNGIPQQVRVLGIELRRPPG